jgi:hypothetical protein
MKKTNLLFLAGFLCLVTVLLSFKKESHSKEDTNLATAVNGAWKLQGSQDDEVAIFTDGYFVRTTYNKANKKLHYTYGGPYELDNSNTLSFTFEFNTANKEAVGETVSVPLRIDANTITLDNNGTTETWKRVDDGKGALAGVWRSGGRLQDGKVTYAPLAARKTFKVFSGTRFQWTAMNTQTKEMLGTGGGTYTFVNGKYTENLEYFSRDSSRVGMSLSFESKVDSDNLYQTGPNSRGEQMSEIWGKVKL